MELRSNFFDLIVGNSFLMWVSRARAVEECHRVLKPGGKVLFPCESMGKNPFWPYTGTVNPCRLAKAWFRE